MSLDQNTENELIELRRECDRLRSEVHNRNKRALDGDKAVERLGSVHLYYETLLDASEKRVANLEHYASCQKDKIEELLDQRNLALREHSTTMKQLTVIQAKCDQQNRLLLKVEDFLVGATAWADEQVDYLIEEVCAAKV